MFSAAAQALSALTDGWSRQLDGSGVHVREVSPPPGEATGNEAHECLLADSLRESVYSSGSAPALTESENFPVLETAPVVLSMRGGLALTQF